MVIIGIIVTISILGMVSILMDIFFIKEIVQVSHKDKSDTKKLNSYATVILDDKEDSLA